MVDNTLDFFNWVTSQNNNKHLCENTGSYYSMCLSYIKREIGIDIYTINSTQEIQYFIIRYENEQELKEINKNSNNTRILSLQKYLEFLEYMSKIVHRKVEKPTFELLDTGIIWNINKQVTKNALVHSNYLCEYDNSHKYFSSNENGKNYVETHHLIPLSMQDKFSYSLHIPANIVSLCIVCHTILHKAILSDKLNILNKLYVERIDNLKISGINISLKELLALY